MRSAYLLVEAMIAIIIAGIVATIFTTMNYYTNIQSNILKKQNTKTILEVARSRLLDSAQDIDSDSYFEPLKQEADGTLPLNIGLGTDAWAKKIYYYTIDLGTHNDVNSSYADTNTSISPNANIVARLISGGEDLTLDTNTTDSSAQNDDILLEIGIGELNHFKLYESSEIQTQTRGYNSAIVSDIAPNTPINGTLWYDVNNSILKIYSQNDNNWTSL
jgi:type II secretory pathway pseudopilin PulG